MPSQARTGGMVQPLHSADGGTTVSTAANVYTGDKVYTGDRTQKLPQSCHEQKRGTTLALKEVSQAEAGDKGVARLGEEEGWAEVLLD